jgi:orotidine-5'-phosphate decarboxylase
VDELRGKDRLIVALDVSSHEEAIALVDRLEHVSFFKVGLQLLMAGDILGFIRRLEERRQEAAQVFVDLKIGGDIRNTVAEFVRACMNTKIVKFLTLVEAVPRAITLDTVRTAKAVRATAAAPRLLIVPYLSSLDSDDLRESGIEGDLNRYIVERAKVMLDAGCDGLVVSGDAIGTCREAFGSAIDIVSPGIRPEWAATNDHKRFTTPAAAIELGADYLVVGRPIVKAARPSEAAQRVIEEIDSALERKRAQSGGRDRSVGAPHAAEAARR